MPQLAEKYAALEEYQIFDTAENILETVLKENGFSCEIQKDTSSPKQEDEKNPMFTWKMIVTNKNGNTITLPYRMGIAHVCRVAQKGRDPKTHKFIWKELNTKINFGFGGEGKMIEREVRKNFEELEAGKTIRIEGKTYRAKTPTIQDIMERYIDDYQTADNYTEKDFITDFYGDSLNYDALINAQQVYRKMQETMHEMRGFFGRELIEDLSE